jgi:hypothetical protein
MDYLNRFSKLTCFKNRFIKIFDFQAKLILQIDFLTNLDFLTFLVEKSIVLEHCQSLETPKKVGILDWVWESKTRPKTPKTFQKTNPNMGFISFFTVGAPKQTIIVNKKFISDRVETAENNHVKMCWVRDLNIRVNFTKTLFKL